MAKVVQQDGLSYISGWMAKKLRSKYPHFGDFTYKKKNHDGSWISELSGGGLTEPTLEYESLVIKMENMFQNSFSNGLPTTIGIKKSLITKLKENIKEVLVEVVELFARRRIIMRVKYLNEQRSSLSHTQKYKKIQKLAGYNRSR